MINFYSRTLNIVNSLKNKYLLVISKKKGIEIDPSVNFSGRPLLKLTPLNNIFGSIIIHKHCKISKGVVINTYGGNVTINQNTFLGEYVVIYGHGSVEIGEGTLIAMQTCIVSSNHTIPGKSGYIRAMPDILLPVKIGSDVWIGAGCKILGGVTIGNGCVVGAGSVVTKDLPPYSISVGSPAKVMKYRDDDLPDKRI